MKNEVTWGVIFGVIGVILVSFAISFLCTAAIVALLCWGLPAIGITTIGTWTIAFSWKLVLIVSFVLGLLRGIFSTKVTVNK